MTMDEAFDTLLAKVAEQQDILSRMAERIADLESQIGLDDGVDDGARTEIDEVRADVSNHHRRLAILENAAELAGWER